MKVEQVLAEGPMDYIKGVGKKIAGGVKSIHQAGVNASNSANIQKQFGDQLRQLSQLLGLVKEIRKLRKQYPNETQQVLNQLTPGVLTNTVWKLLGEHPSHPAQGAPQQAPAQGAPQQAPAQGAPQQAPAQGAPQQAPAQGAPQQAPSKPPAKRRGITGTYAERQRRAKEEEKQKELEKREMIRASHESKQDTSKPLVEYFKKR